MSVNLSELFPPSGSSSGGGDVDCNIDVSENPPAPPYEIGQQFFSTSTGREYVWVGSGWAATSVTGGATGDGGSGGVGGDPYWLNVRLLINGDGEANGSQNIVDATGSNQITVVNGAKVSTVVNKYGTGSIDLTGSTSELQANDGLNGIALGSGDFTLEMWVWLNGTALTQVLTDWRPAGGPHAGMPMLYCNGTSLRWWSGTVDVANTGNGKLVNSQWMHVAASRDSGTMRLFIDGIEEASAGDTNTYVEPQDKNIHIGATNGQFELNGYIDDYRLTLGVARYKSDFIPPDKLPTQQGARVITVDIPEEPMQAEDNDADLS